jgi:hypothetical protein
MKNRFIITSIGILLLLIASYFFLKNKHIIYLGDELGDISSEFCELNLDDSVSGKVLYVVSQELRANNPLKTDMILYDHSKIWFRTKKSTAFKPKYFNEFIQNEDSIFKRIKSDTIFIIRNEERFYFILEYY